ncbi:MAG: uroporphyrinogen decarboxylase family protein, partial [Clostridiales bacterium]|nr:uroporphyrinogen decarboxylase family protein [Clostridiales bacterium]
MTHKERLIAALERKPITGLVPHIELAFFLTMEALGKVHPIHRNYGQWDQMSEKERELHRNEIAGIYVDTAKRYNHSAIAIHQNPNTFEETCILIDKIRERSGNEYFITMHGDATFAIPNGDYMEEFTYRIADEPEKLLDEADELVNNSLAFAEKMSKHGGLDCFNLCSDYCLNTGPFLSPSMFSEYVTPFLAKLIIGYKDMGFYTIKHTDGNIMPIIDQLVQANPHALHSLDPQAG